MRDEGNCIVIDRNGNELDIGDFIVHISSSKNNNFLFPAISKILKINTNNGRLQVLRESGKLSLLYKTERTILYMKII